MDTQRILFKGNSMKDNERRSGRTTRQVDEAIQTLFREGRVKIPRDHSQTPEGNHNLYRKIKNRLYSEHVGMCKIEDDVFIVVGYES